MIRGLQADSFILSCTVKQLPWITETEATMVCF